MKLKVATWNIGGAKPIRSIESFAFRDEDYLAEDTDYFASKIRGLDPDIICLQETHVNTERSVAQEIAQAAGGYACIEVGLSESHIDPAYELGNAVLVKQKPATEEFYTLPYPDFPLSLPDGGIPHEHKKGIQVLEYSFGNIANTHLQPLRFLGTPYESENGQRYAHEVEREFETHFSAPLILCGDFNYAHAADLYKDFVTKLQLTNVLPHEPTRPDGKITDYIFSSPEFSLIDAGIERVMADHFLCWAEFEYAD
ncbi:MAG: endonuclease/exonuclease/phosphatase family protein [Bacillota bacterium]